MPKDLASGESVPDLSAGSSVTDLFEAHARRSSLTATSTALSVVHSVVAKPLAAGLAAEDEDPDALVRRAATLAELVENATENRRLLIRTVFEPEIGYVLQAEAEGARPLPDAYVPTSAEIVESVLTVQDHGSMFPGMDDEAPIV